MKKYSLSALIAISCLSAGFMQGAYAASTNSFEVGVRGGMVATSVSSKFIDQETATTTTATFNVNNDDAAAGLFARWLHQLPNHYYLGAEASYTYLNIHQGQDIENQSDGSNTSVKVTARNLFELDANLGYPLSQNVTFLVFGGPAIMQTGYTLTDTEDGAFPVGNHYQITANLGAEINWQVKQNLAVGLRVDHIFQTPNRSISVRPSSEETDTFSANTKATLYEMSLAYSF